MLSAVTEAQKEGMEWKCRRETEFLKLGRQERHLGGVSFESGLGHMNKSDVVWDEQNMETGEYRACRAMV